MGRKDIRSFTSHWKTHTYANVILSIAEMFRIWYNFSIILLNHLTNTLNAFFAFYFHCYGRHHLYTIRVAVPYTYGTILNVNLFKRFSSIYTIFIKSILNYVQVFLHNFHLMRAIACKILRLCSLPSSSAQCTVHMALYTSER